MGPEGNCSSQRGGRYANSGRSTRSRDRARARCAAAGPGSGTRCGLPAFMREPSMVHVRSTEVDLGPSGPRTSPLRVAVRDGEFKCPGTVTFECAQVVHESGQRDGSCFATFRGEAGIDARWPRHERGSVPVFASLAQSRITSSRPRSRTAFCVLPSHSGLSAALSAQANRPTPHPACRRQRASAPLQLAPSDRNQNQSFSAGSSWRRRDGAS